MTHTVAVTGLKTVESPQPGFAIARSLKEAGYYVVGIDDSPLTAALQCPWFDEVHALFELRSERIDDFLRILQRLSRVTAISTIVPGFDRDVYFFADHRSALLRAGIRVVAPSLESLRRSSKPYLHELRRDGIAVPKTVLVRSKAELRREVRRFRFPVVCKGLIKDAYVAGSVPEALTFFESLRNIWGGGSGPVILQEFIFGEPYCVAGVADWRSRIIGAVAIKKLGVDSKGTTWCGHTVHEPRLHEIARRVVSEIGWIGGFEVEMIRRKGSGGFYVFEFNPRLPSWVYLATVAGQNLPDLLARLALGLNLPTRSARVYSSNVAFVRAPFETTCSLGQLLKLVKTTSGIGAKNGQQSR